MTAWHRLLRLLPGYDPFAQAEGFHFDEAAARKAIRFVTMHCRHAIASVSVDAGAPFKLSPWQASILANLFGWKDTRGLRRYREVFVYVPKKSGKTAFAAAILLYVMVCDNEYGARIFSAAASMDQAALVFEHVSGMIRQDEELSSRLHVFGASGGAQIKTVTYEDAQSSYKCLAADAHTADGKNPHLNVIDEVHRHKTPELATVLHKSSAARRQPITLYTTTADYNRPSMCNDLLKRAKNVIANKGDKAAVGFEPRFLPVVYEASKDDDYMSEATWKKANPNYGITVGKDFFETESKKAKENPAELNDFLRLHLNIVTDADVAWLTMDKWDACGESFDPAMLLGRQAYGGLDLATSRDLAAFVLFFPGDPHYVLSWFWCPEDNARIRENRDRVPYSAWQRQGFITLTPGSGTDWEFIRHCVNEQYGKFDIRCIGFDPWNAKSFAENSLMSQDGLPMMETRQGFVTLNEPMKRLYDIISERKLRHNAHPILRWNAGNVMVKTDPAGNIKPDKAKSSERIDGMSALVTAMAVWLKAESSPYDGGGIKYIGSDGEIRDVLASKS